MTGDTIAQLANNKLLVELHDVGYHPSRSPVYFAICTVDQDEFKCEVVKADCEFTRITIKEKKN